MASLLLSARKSKQFLEKKDDCEKPSSSKSKRKAPPPKEEAEPKAATKPKKNKKTKWSQSLRNFWYHTSLLIRIDLSKCFVLIRYNLFWSNILFQHSTNGDQSLHDCFESL